MWCLIVCESCVGGLDVTEMRCGACRVRVVGDEM